MKTKFLALAVLSIILLVSPVFGQNSPVTFLGLRSAPVETSYGGIAGGVAERKPIESKYPPIEDVMQKMKNKERLTNREFIAYILAVEALNPLKGWQQIVTRLHAAAYPQDTDLKICGIRLFKNGAENEGWEEVTLPMGLKPPLNITDRKGQLIKVAHTYAAIRAGLNRSGLNSWAMSNVNAGWGDSVQVVGYRIIASQEYLAGAFHNYDKCYAAMDDFAKAPDYKSPAEVLGNELGLNLQRYLKVYPASKLSEAYIEFIAY